ncbi:MAG: hypothetical protein HOQ05_03170 [Corynebacteriales bacterium]|nr:hypothetical protein [Mycobacteriales bacterium]
MNRKRTVVSVIVALAFSAAIALSGSTAVGATDVDWKNARVPVPVGTHCPAGDVQFNDGMSEHNDYLYRILPNPSVPVYGDVDGNGDRDALLRMQCGPKNSEYSEALIAVSANGDALYPLATVLRADDWGQQFTNYAVFGSVVRVTVSDEQQSWVRWFEWNANTGTFVEITR